MTQRNGIKNSLKLAAVALLCFALLLPSLTPPKFEQEFGNNRILVVLDKRISKANKKLNKNFFSFLKDDESTNFNKFFPFRAAFIACNIIYKKFIYSANILHHNHTLILFP